MMQTFPSSTTDTIWSIVVTYRWPPISYWSTWLKADDHKLSSAKEVPVSMLICSTHASNLRSITIKVAKIVGGIASW